MRVLVTGANGFIGRHLVWHLAACGHTVLAVSRESSAAPEGLPIIQHQIDRVDARTDWRPLLRNMDAVVHLAGVAHRTGKDPATFAAELERVNVAGTLQLYAQCGGERIGRFIFASSLAAVTSRSIGRVDDSTPCAPTTPYGFSKRRAEEAIASAHATGGTDYTILRPPLIYGAGNPANMARLVGLIRSGLPLPFAKLRNRRSFLYVGNFCDVVHRCLIESGARNQTFLLSDGADMSTPEFIRRIALNLGRPERLFPFPPSVLRTLVCLRPDGVLAKLVGSLYLDISAVRSELAWSPPFSVDAGLSSTFGHSKTIHP